MPVVVEYFPPRGRVVRANMREVMVFANSRHEAMAFVFDHLGLVGSCRELTSDEAEAWSGECVHANPRSLLDGP